MDQEEDSRNYLYSGVRTLRDHRAAEDLADLPQTVDDGLGKAASRL
jgi:hypothetical protein